MSHLLPNASKNRTINKIVVASRVGPVRNKIL
jgi:hypothetical protein